MDVDDDESRVKLMRCAGIECCEPIWSMSLSFGFLIFAEENGVKVLNLRNLIKGKEKRVKNFDLNGKSETNMRSVGFLSELRWEFTVNHEHGRHSLAMQKPVHSGEGETEEIGYFLGNMIGEVKEVDLETNSDGSGRFLRVRVTIQAKIPLQQSIRVDFLGSGKVTTMLLRYERLLDFCFKCSRLGHILGECPNMGAQGDVLTDANRKLAVWIRAVSPPKQTYMGHGRGDSRSWGKNNGFEGSKQSLGIIDAPIRPGGVKRL
ncbi:hypothetical protein Dsin_000530 [Dipteronia sinensis]|uniref:CCHC-type domain-containing protein n=1 Tax=Dipteronia sinensis TaxID=43782 RepID=A0AAE0B3U5_9ROSI|nr:hypothetical protein Dsin_000530 [Dipteronia sinensis]